jgi:hypothetical protein
VEKLKMLKKECELLKRRIKELKNVPITEHNESIIKIQMSFLKEALTRVGQQLRNRAISKGVDNDF